MLAFSAGILLSSFVLAAAQPTLCAVSNALKIPLNASCASIGGDSAGDIASSRGEFEALQILIDGGLAGASNLTLSVSFTGGVPEGISWSLAYVGYVFCAPTTRYGGSGGGWRPDMLMPWPASGLNVLPSTSLTAWITFNVSAGTSAKVYDGAVLGMAGGSPAGSLPFTLTVWPTLLPAIGDPNAFTTIYAYSPDFSLPNSTLKAGLDQLAALRFPATQIYLTSPFPIWYYEYLAGQGAPLLVLADVANLDLPGASGAIGSTSRGGPRSPPSPQSGPRMLQDSCPVSYNSTYVSAMIAFLTPTVNALSASGLLSRAAVYGFDELVRMVFNAPPDSSALLF
jgi:hypothetical protein